MKKLITDFMKEAQMKTVICDNVNEATFELFAQFAYTENYTPPVFSMKIS